jgi:integrase
MNGGAGPLSTRSGAPMQTGYLWRIVRTVAAAVQCCARSRTAMSRNRPEGRPEQKPLAPTGIRSAALVSALRRCRLRLGEALALRPTDIDPDAGTITSSRGKVTNGGSSPNSSARYVHVWGYRTSRSRGGRGAWSAPLPVQLLASGRRGCRRREAAFASWFRSSGWSTRAHWSSSRP